MNFSNIKGRKLVLSVNASNPLPEQFLINFQYALNYLKLNNTYGKDIIP